MLEVPLSLLTLSRWRPIHFRCRVGSKTCDECSGFVFPIHPCIKGCRGWFASRLILSLQPSLAHLLESRPTTSRGIRTGHIRERAETLPTHLGPALGSEGSCSTESAEVPGKPAPGTGNKGMQSCCSCPRIVGGSDSDTPGQEPVRRAVAEAGAVHRGTR